jgi:hypothetical protein
LREDKSADTKQGHSRAIGAAGSPPAFAAPLDSLATSCGSSHMTAILQEYKKFFQKNTDRNEKTPRCRGVGLIQNGCAVDQFSMYFSGLTGIPFKWTS